MTSAERAFSRRCWPKKASIRIAFGLDRDIFDVKWPTRGLSRELGGVIHKYGLPLLVVLISPYQFHLRASVNMPGAALATTTDVNQIEAPVTWKAYLICAFASFGGIFFGFVHSALPVHPQSSTVLTSTKI